MTGRIAALRDFPPYQRVAVVGGGGWGTALAAAAARAGRDVCLWARRDDVVLDIRRNGRNSAYLGDAPLPRTLSATSSLETALWDADAVLLVTPSETVREVSRQVARFAPDCAPIIVCAKGIEHGSGRLMTEIVADERPGGAVAALSGPTFAAEVVRDLPTAVTIASAFDAPTPQGWRRSVAARAAVSLTNGAFRVYVSDDPVGVEIGGAMKNVVAIACGVAQGAGFGANMRAALVTRGLDEMKRLSEALGGRRETVTGLSGLGDLTLTCSSTQSRNLRFGIQLGEGLSAAETFGGAPVVVEGARNAVSVTDLARRRGLDLPICEAVRRIVDEAADIAATMTELWSRPLEAEPKALDFSVSHPAPELVEKTMEELVG